MSAENHEHILLTPAAKKHLFSLLKSKQQESQQYNFKIEVLHQYTPNIKIDISFCKAEDNNSQDLELNFQDFKIYINKNSIDVLKDAVVDFEGNEDEGQITFKGPNLINDPFEHFDKNTSLIEKINYIVNLKINPSLSTHGGSVEVKDLDEENGIVYVEFSGGCQGCSMAKITLKQYIEKILLESFPQIKEIQDVTEHAKGADPFY